jgi:subtilisin family serine protease
MQLNIMKSILCAVVFYSALTFAGIGKLDPRLGLLVRNPNNFSSMRGLSKSAEGWKVDAIVTLNGPARELRQAGVTVICSFHDIAIVSIPVEEIERISQLSCVKYVESCQPAYACLDKSVPMIGANKVHQQLGYTGKGVIVGIIDSGIDWKNRDFIDAAGKTRIKYILDLSLNGSRYGGVEYDEQDVNSALAGLRTIEEYDYSGHGTHVAGIAAGDGSSTAEFGEYSGVAPEADLVIVKATRDANSSEFLNKDQIIGLAYIDSVADVLGKPYVINMSFGGHAGAHDGSSTAERLIDRMVGRGISGKAIVTVAGNDGEKKLHARVVLPKNTGTQDITFQVEPYNSNTGAENDMIQFDAWYTGSKKVTVQVIPPSGLLYGKVDQGQVLDRATAEGTIYAWNGYYEAENGYAEGVNPFNGDREMYIQLLDGSMWSVPKSGTWTLRFEGAEAVVDVWLASSTMTVAFVQGDVETGRISIPGTANNVITAGAYLSKKVWTDLDGNMLTIDSQNKLQIGDLASFSSGGPTRDGRVKPEIVAPGQMIASSYSEKASPQSAASIFKSGSVDYVNGLILDGGQEAVSMGTSMAAPHVTGVVALLLQKYPDATANQIRDLLIQSADKDTYVGSAPNDRWGWGKLNALNAFQLTPGKEPPIEYRLLKAYPNPFSSTTKIVFEIPVTNSVNITEINVYNVLGQRVRALLSEIKSADQHQVYWDGRDDMGYLLANGVYFIGIHSGTYDRFEKLIFMPPKN